MTSSIEAWLGQVASEQADKENQAPQSRSLTSRCKNARCIPLKRSRGSIMAAFSGDIDLTPRPSKRRRSDEPPNPPRTLSPPAESSSNCGSSTSELESHHSGRNSPTKQMQQLEDLDRPVVFRNFYELEDTRDKDARELSFKCQRLADGIGILGFTDSELGEILRGAGAVSLNSQDKDRFQYTWANDTTSRSQTGSMVTLGDAQRIVETAVECNREQSHEFDWNEEVHIRVLELALASSCYARTLAVKSLKYARIDPPTLANASLPSRVVDYGIVLKPDDKIEAAYNSLRPLPCTAKSWNHSTLTKVRRNPIAISIETKSPYKSWTHGLPQLAIWTEALFNRLGKIQLDSSAPQIRLRPAMPCIITQGHDWHLVIFADSSSDNSREFVVWEKINIGSTRNCFDLYKLIAVLHFLMDWAESIWRPFFHSLLGSQELVLNSEAREE